MKFSRFGASGEAGIIVFGRIIPSYPDLVGRVMGAHYPCRKNKARFEGFEGKCTGLSF